MTTKSALQQTDLCKSNVSLLAQQDRYVADARCLIVMLQQFEFVTDSTFLTFRTQLANRTSELLLTEEAPINDMVFDSQSSALWVATASSTVNRFGQQLHNSCRCHAVLYVTVSGGSVTSSPFYLNAVLRLVNAAWRSHLPVLLQRM